MDFDGGDLWLKRNIFDILGTIDLQGHICELHSGGVGATDSCLPEFVPGGDVGKLWEPGLSG